MAQLAVLMAGLLLSLESRASDVADRSTLQGFLSKYMSSRSDASNDHDKFIAPNVDRVKHITYFAMQYSKPHRKDGEILGPNMGSLVTIVKDKPLLHPIAQVQYPTAFAAARGEPSTSAKDLHKVPHKATDEVSGCSIGPIVGVVGFIMFAAMLGHRLCKRFQQLYISSIIAEQGLDTTKASALLANTRTLELRSQDSENMQDGDLQSALASMESGAASSQAPRDNFRSSGWGQPPSTVSRPLTAACAKPPPVEQRPATQLSAYVPSGMSPEEWEKIKAKEKKAKTNLGAGGARGFKSRSFGSFVQALEKSEATHLYAVNPEDVAAAPPPTGPQTYHQLLMHQEQLEEWEEGKLTKNAKLRRRRQLGKLLRRRKPWWPERWTSPRSLLRQSLDKPRSLLRRPDRRRARNAKEASRAEGLSFTIGEKLQEALDPGPQERTVRLYGSISTWNTSSGNYAPRHHTCLVSRRATTDDAADATQRQRTAERQAQASAAATAALQADRDEMQREDSNGYDDDDDVNYYDDDGVNYWFDVDSLRRREASLTFSTEKDALPEFGEAFAFGDMTVENVARDYRFPLSYIADVITTFGVQPPISDTARIGDLLDVDEAFALLEAVTSLDASEVDDKYVSFGLTGCAQRLDASLAEVFAFCVDNNFALPHGVLTRLRREQFEVIASTLGRRTNEL